MGAAIRLARKWHERAREGRLLVPLRTLVGLASVTR